MVPPDGSIHLQQGDPSSNTPPCCPPAFCAFCVFVNIIHWPFQSSSGGCSHWVSFFVCSFLFCKILHLKEVEKYRKRVNKRNGARLSKSRMRINVILATVVLRTGEALMHTGRLAELNWSSSWCFRGVFQVRYTRLRLFVAEFSSVFLSFTLVYLRL